MGITIGMLGAATPYFTGKIFDDAIPQAERGLLVQFAVALLAMAFTTAAFDIAQAIAILRISGRMDYSIGAALWDRYRQTVDRPASLDTATLTHALRLKQRGQASPRHCGDQPAGCA